ncbi:hypothetical protein [Natrinema versiforme]|uniref:Uncharacterized protein n=1 Tax=Natrinema versiforme JCM 10478 TaxID=1227496 RepID=L9Y5A9_9EURY|nr:hypothetical protein [Natrinema versiforme]ELY68043.1 hypothetical protein C489_08565 [Natrinema versiforme JCM 10478]
MVSADGLKTWFDYQLLFLGLAIAFVCVITASSQLVAYLGTLPLTDSNIEPTDPTFALTVAGGGLFVIVLLIVLTGLLNRNRQ